MPTWWNGRHEGLKVEMTIVIKFECIGEKSLCRSTLIRWKFLLSSYIGLLSKQYG